MLITQGNKKTLFPHVTAVDCLRLISVTISPHLHVHNHVRSFVYPLFAYLDWQLLLQVGSGLMCGGRST